MKVVIASGNAGKIRELQTMVKDLQMTLIPASELGVAEIPETAVTFVENALLKARHACTQTNLPALADDSGLVVNALQGAPGIYSARFAGPDATTEKNIDKLLQAMQHVPADERLASFHCVLVYMNDALDPTPLICHGIWHGSILTARRGAQGFGYDPIFYATETNLSAAELPVEMKNRLSHRGQALQLLLDQLPKKIMRTNHVSH